MKKHIRNALYFALGLLGLNSTSAMACVEMYLCIDNIQGEATDAEHANCIDVLAWSWGMSQSGTTHVGGGGGAGVVSVQDISLTKWIDKSSPDLLLHVASGKHLTKAELFNYRCGEVRTDYWKITMEDLIVSSASSGGSNGEDRLTENITLNFAKVDWCYTGVDAKGSTLAEECFGWDIQANTTQ